MTSAEADYLAASCLYREFVLRFLHAKKILIGCVEGFLFDGKSSTGRNETQDLLSF